MPTFDLNETIRLTAMTLDKFAETTKQAFASNPDDNRVDLANTAVTLALAAMGDLAKSITRMAHATERAADAQEAILAVAVADFDAAVAEGVAASHATIKQAEHEELKRTPLGQWPVDITK